MDIIYVLIILQHLYTVDKMLYRSNILLLTQCVQLYFFKSDLFNSIYICKVTIQNVTIYRSHLKLIATDKARSPAHPMGFLCQSFLFDQLI